jgi:hypothetical protein
MNEPIPDRVLENILAELDESARLKKLSNEELVMECIQHAHTDCAIVDEMCDRLFPNWCGEEKGH